MPSIATAAPARKGAAVIMGAAAPVLPIPTVFIPGAGRLPVVRAVAWDAAMGLRVTVSPITTIEFCAWVVWGAEVVVFAAELVVLVTRVVVDFTELVVVSSSSSSLTLLVGATVLVVGLAVVVTTGLAVVVTTVVFAVALATVVLLEPQRVSYSIIWWREGLCYSRCCRRAVIIVRRGSTADRHRGSCPTVKQVHCAICERI